MNLPHVQAVEIRTDQNFGAPQLLTHQVFNIWESPDGIDQSEDFAEGIGLHVLTMKEEFLVRLQLFNKYAVHFSDHRSKPGKWLAVHCPDRQWKLQAGDPERAQVGSHPAPQHQSPWH